VVSGTSGRYYLSAVETLEYYSRLQGDQAAREQASFMAEAVTYFLGEEEPAAQMYKHLHHVWLQLPLLPTMQRWLTEVAFAYSLLQRAGVAPQIQACTQCHVREPHEAIVLDGVAGGWRCLSCHHQFTAAARYSLTPGSLQVLQFLSRYPQHVSRIKIASEQAWQLTAAIRHYVAAAAGKPLPRVAVQPSFAMPYA
jgi:DNA repair protein RecO